MKFLIRLYLAACDLETNRFLKRVAVFLFVASIAAFAAVIAGHIYFMRMNMHPTAEIVIFAGLFFSIGIFLYAINLAALTVIGTNAAKIRELYVKRIKSRKKSL